MVLNKFRLVFGFLFIISELTYSQSNDHNERIVGGDSIDITQAPYQVQVEYRNDFICGGTIFKPNAIITAAHCFIDTQTKDITVRVGSTYQTEEGTVYHVSDIIIPDGFDITQSYDNDIAIVKLTENLEYGNSVEAIELINEEPEEGDSATVTGWGLLKENGLPSYELQAVVLPVQNWDSCNENYAPVLNYQLTERMFCAGIEGKDACRGDSGGPLVINGKLAGVTSFGNGCGRPQFPGVFTNIVKFTEWIIENTS